MPAATSAAAFCGFILCSSTPMVVMTTMSGSAVDERMLSALSCALSRTRRKKTSVGSPRVKRNSRAKRGTSSSTFGMCDQRVEVEVDAALDEEDRDEEPEADRLELARDLLGVVSPRMNRRTTTPAAKAPRSTSRLSLMARYTRKTTSVTEMRTGSWDDEFRWRPEHGDQPRRMHLDGEQRGRHGDDGEHRPGGGS